MTKHSLLIVTGFLSAVLAFGWSGRQALAGNESAPAQNVELVSTLRGYGKVAVEFQGDEGSGTVRAFRFDAEDEKHAALMVGKFLADLDLSPGVSKSSRRIGGKSFPVVMVQGGSVYTGFILGHTGRVIAADSMKALDAFLTKSPWVVKAVTTNLEYPKYLDRFDRYGWGFYGFSGNTNMHGWKERLPGAGPDADPADDMDFLQKYDFRFELWPQPGLFDTNYSVGEWPELWWQVEEAKKRNIALGCRLYGEFPMVKELGDAFERPAPFLQGGWMRQDIAQKTLTHPSWFSEKARLYMARQAQEQMRPLLKENITSWMSPYGELVHDEWYNYHADYSPDALKDWHRTLKEKLDLGLPEVSAMFNRANQPFASWSEVPIPEIATFAGLAGMIKEMQGNWQVRLEATPDEGLNAQWWNADTSEKSWETMDLPGSIKWHKFYRKQSWMIHDFKLTSEELAGNAPIYLYSFAKMFGSTRVTSLVYLNGQKVGETGRWGAWEVRQLLKPGQNRLALRSDNFTGRVFLSTEEPSVYPYLGAARNRLWVIFQDWLKDGKRDAWKVALSAMREVEPNVPIKFMAPMGFGTDRWIELATSFGGWPHFTGEGMWYYPWYKRYGFLYGLPGGSEMAGPEKDAAEMFMAMQRTFLAGLNSHDHVFFVQAATRVPEIKKWYEDHIAVLKQMGRYDIAGPQVLLFRSTNSATNFMPAPIPALGEKTREFQSYWNWDIGRGTLQTIGQSNLYIDDGGLKDGKLSGYPILVDCGNEIITRESIQAIDQWVREGGTYVVLPFTGRCLPESPDSWPIKALTGCTVKAMRTPGKGSVVIAKDQTLFKELAGKTFEDNGSTKDCNDYEHNLISTELEPSGDCTTVARFENGEPAIVVRKLGKGRVISLGSTFFRQVKDVQGMWLPSDLESIFYRDLFNGLGQPSVNSTDDFKILTQRYLTNNGLDDVVVLTSFADGDRNVTLTSSFERPPTHIYRAAGDKLEELKGFKLDGNTVTISNVKIPKSEVQVYYFRTGNAVAAGEHWWNYQRRIWQPSQASKVDFSPISKPSLIDPTLDLKADWKWTQEKPQDDTWRTAGKATDGWKSWHLDVFNAVGADATRTLYATKTFSIPQDWLKDAGKTRLVAANWDGGPGRLTVANSAWRLWLNGQLLEKKGFFNPEVGSLLKSGENILAMEIDPPAKGKYIGVLGAVYLTHSKPPVETISLAGEWTGELDGTPVSLHFPGIGKARWPSRKFMVPADWEDKYIVTYYAKDARNLSGQGSRQSSMGVIVNEREVRRRHHHMFGNEVEVDITSLLNFGKENEFAPFSSGPLVEPMDWDFETIELRLYPKKEYRNE